MNRRIVYILFAVIVVVVIGLGWFALISPTRQDVATTNSSITAERDKLATTQAQLRQAEETSKEGRQNQARLLELTKMVPNGDEIPSLLLQIQDLANESGISFMSITPSDLIQVNDYQILPLQVQFEGRFFDLSDFVYRAEQMVAGPGRLLAIKTLGLVPNSTDASSSGSVA
ncbi:MAG TPA: type 4a pilus biogenesis protein PilO [Thermoleophilia bacterium]